jgi:hypothetical protein
MPISSGQVTVGTAAVQIDGTSASVYRLHIHNNDNQVNLYIGGSDVTIANGLVLEKTDTTEIQVPPGDSVWIVSSSNNHLVSYLKVA